MNPAYMMRQIHELGEQLYGLKAHITSLRLLRPENAPDPWEREALHSLKKGADEVIEMCKIEGECFTRLMRPLYINQSCLKCHASQGYQLGDFRGGVSISIPMSPLHRAADSYMTSLYWGHGGLWLVGMVGICIYMWRANIHEWYRREIEKTLCQSNQRLEQFTYADSHDLREPLRSISGFTRIIGNELNSELENNPKLQKYFQYILDGSQRMSSLLDGMLAYSRTGREEFESVNITEIIEEVIKNLDAIIKDKQVVITTDVMPMVIANKAALTQVFQNLINNAIKHHGKKTSPKIHLGVAQLDHEWMFSVQDNGIGIEQKYHDQIFRLFSVLTRNKVAGTGTGIGLSIIQKSVEIHKRRIWLDSKIDEGTTFYFTVKILKNA